MASLTARTHQQQRVHLGVAGVVAINGQVKLNHQEDAPGTNDSKPRQVS